MDERKESCLGSGAAFLPVDGGSLTSAGVVVGAAMLQGEAGL